MSFEHDKKDRNPANLKNIPVLRFLKEPAIDRDHLMHRYPDGGQWGWFAFVEEDRTFAYWDNDTNKWELINGSVIDGDCIINGLNPDEVKIEAANDKDINLKTSGEGELLYNGQEVLTNGKMVDGTLGLTSTGQLSFAGQNGIELAATNGSVHVNTENGKTFYFNGNQVATTDQIVDKDAFEAHIEEGNLHLRKMPEGGINDVFGVGTQGIYTQGQYVYAVEYRTLTRSTNQIRLDIRTGKISTRNFVNDWSEWVEVSGASGDFVVNGVSPDSVTIDSVEDTHLYSEKTVDVAGLEARINAQNDITIASQRGTIYLNSSGNDTIKINNSSPLVNGDNDFINMLVTGDTTIMSQHGFSVETSEDLSNAPIQLITTDSNIELKTLGEGKLLYNDKELATADNTIAVITPAEMNTITTPGIYRLSDNSGFFFIDNWNYQTFIGQSEIKQRYTAEYGWEKIFGWNDKYQSQGMQVSNDEQNLSIVSEKGNVYIEGQQIELNGYLKSKDSPVLTAKDIDYILTFGVKNGDNTKALWVKAPTINFSANYGRSDIDLGYGGPYLSGLVVGSRSREYTEIQADGVEGIRLIAPKCTFNNQQILVNGETSGPIDIVTDNDSILISSKDNSGNHGVGIEGGRIELISESDVTICADENIHINTKSRLYVESADITQLILGNGLKVQTGNTLFEAGDIEFRGNSFTYNNIPVLTNGYINGDVNLTTYNGNINIATPANDTTKIITLKGGVNKIVGNTRIEVGTSDYISFEYDTINNKPVVTMSDDMKAAFKTALGL